MEKPWWAHGWPDHQRGACDAPRGVPRGPQAGSLEGDLGLWWRLRPAGDTLWTQPGQTGELHAGWGQIMFTHSRTGQSVIELSRLIRLFKRSGVIKNVCGSFLVWLYAMSVCHRLQAEGESSALRDGSLVDLCGATLLWRTGEGLLRAPTLRHLEALRQELNASRPQCPVGLSTLAFPSLPRSHRWVPHTWVYDSVLAQLVFQKYELFPIRHNTENKSLWFVSALKNDSPGSTSPAAMSMDATTGARDLREKSYQERAKAPQSAENVPCAGVWVPTCLCGWAVSPLCTWTPELRLTVLCRAATSAQRGQPGTGLRPRCPMGRTPSDPSAPSAPLPSAPPAGRGSSSRAPSTSHHTAATTITVTERRLSFIHVTNVD